MLFGSGEPDADPAPGSRSSSPALLLRIAREYDRKGHLDETITAYEAAIGAAETAGDAATAAEALRRLAVVRHRRQDTAEARALCARSEAVAREARHEDLIAEALNTAGGLDLVEEHLDAARGWFLRALELATEPDLRGRIEQNLGTVASMQGDFPAAMERYQLSLAGFLAASNDHGCAVAYHNLGVISIDLRRWEEADRHLRLCLHIVQRTGDLHLRGLAMLNHAEALMPLGRMREARLAAETAAGIFDEIHAPRELADAYRVLGCVLRKTGEPARAHGKLLLAVEVAATSRCPLGEAEATRELALVQAALGRTEEAAGTMARAAAQLDGLKPVGTTENILAGDYPSSVRAWGELIAVLDPEGLSHAERVASAVVDVARAMGYDDDGQARIRIGAFLHEVDPDHLREAALHWDLGPMIRCHRERRDGSGRPLGLRGDEIPLEAEIIGIVDAHDGAPAMGSAAETWWRPAVVTAFRRFRAA